MNNLPHSITKRIAELGRRSRPLGETYARELGAKVANLVAKELKSGGCVERILDIYEVRLGCDLEADELLASSTKRPRRRPVRLSEALPSFSRTDIFDRIGP